MTETEIRIAVAEACGWTSIQSVRLGDDYSYDEPGLYGWRPGTTGPKINAPHTVPNYPASLDAMHEAEKVLTDDYLCGPFSSYLQSIVGHHRILTCVHRATAAQRAEAFLRTLNLWPDAAPDGGGR